MMLSLNDDKVDKLLQTLQPQTRRAIAMWKHDKLGPSSAGNPTRTAAAVASRPLPRSGSARQVLGNTGRPEISEAQMRQQVDIIPISRQAQQGQLIERYVSIANSSDGQRTAGATGAGSQQHYRVAKKELWQGWDSQPPVRVDTFTPFTVGPAIKEVTRLANKQAETGIKEEAERPFKRPSLQEALSLQESGRQHTEKGAPAEVQKVAAEVCQELAAGAGAGAEAEATALQQLTPTLSPSVMASMSSKVEIKTQMYGTGLIFGKALSSTFL